MEKVLRLCCFSYLYGITGQKQMQYVCGRMSRAAQKRNPGRGSQRLHRALGGTRILLAAAPTAPPCFCRWQRSSLLLFESTRSMSLTLSQNKNFSALAYAEAFWWSEVNQIRTIALWGIFGGDLIESNGFRAVFVVERNQNFFHHRDKQHS